MRSLLSKLFFWKQGLLRLFFLKKRHIDVGAYSYGIPKVYAYGDGTRLAIGKFCSISARVTIFLGGEHRYDWITTYPFNVKWKKFAHIQGNPRSKGDVVIGNDVWIGYGATIFSGVRIGDGAVIAAHAVVTKNVPPYAVFYGNPAGLLFYRFSAEKIAALLKIRWWDWEIAKIMQLVPSLQSNRIDEFLKMELDRAEKTPADAP